MAIHITKFIIPLGIFFQLSTLALASEYSATVSHVIDGDTIVTTTSEHIRLLDINTPELGKKGKPSQPFAKKAKEYLKKLVLNKKIIVKTGKTPKDRYKRTLAHLYLHNGTWLNKKMISSGLAHVYSFPDNRERVTELLTYETQARKQNKGIWSHPRWQIKSSNETFSDNTIGKFHLIKGTVTNTVHIKKTTYLNFGDNWKTDFTVEIPDKYLKSFTEKDITPHKYYNEKTLIVRGILKPINGVLVTATHPEQLTLLP